MQFEFRGPKMGTHYAALVAASILALTFSSDGGAQAKFKVLHAFQGGSGDGARPEAGLLRDSAGNLYGTTSEGGTNQQGTVFKLAPDGAETILHKFNYDDGAGPAAGLISDDAGNLYGTTGVWRSRWRWDGV